MIVNRTLNAASAKVYGLDADVAFSPRGAPGLNLYAAANYNHARYGSFPNAPCGNGQSAAQGCNQLRNPTTGNFSAQDLSGRVLVRAPKWMGNVGFDYDLPVSGSLKFGIGGQASFSSRYSVNLTDLPGFFQPSYTKLNATVSIGDADDAWEFSLLGNNLTNKITTGSCSNSNLQNGSFFGGQIQGGAVWARPGATRRTASPTAGASCGPGSR